MTMIKVHADPATEKWIQEIAPDGWRLFDVKTTTVTQTINQNGDHAVRTEVRMTLGCRHNMLERADRS